jgi:hypothetical protein
MEKLTMEIIEELRNISGYDSLVDTVVASRIIDSDQLYQEAIQRLIITGVPPNKEQSNRMGIEATHTVMMAIINSLKEKNVVEIVSLGSEVTRLKMEINKKVVTARRERAAAVLPPKKPWMVCPTR